MHWPHLKREQTERLMIGAAGLLGALILIGGVFALLTKQVPGTYEVPPLFGIF
jgi:hypothetical protein